MEDVREEFIKLTHDMIPHLQEIMKMLPDECEWLKIELTLECVYIESNLGTVIFPLIKQNYPN